MAYFKLKKFCDTSCRSSPIVLATAKHRTGGSFNASDTPSKRQLTSSTHTRFCLQQKLLNASEQRQSPCGRVAPACLVLRMVLWKQSPPRRYGPRCSSTKIVFLKQVPNSTREISLACGSLFKKCAQYRFLVSTIRALPFPRR